MIVGCEGVGGCWLASVSTSGDDESGILSTSCSKAACACRSARCAQAAACAASRACASSARTSLAACAATLSFRRASARKDSLAVGGLHTVHRLSILGVDGRRRRLEMPLQ